MVESSYEYAVCGPAEEAERSQQCATISSTPLRTLNAFRCPVYVVSQEAVLRSPSIQSRGNTSYASQFPALRYHTIARPLKTRCRVCDLRSVLTYPDVTRSRDPCNEELWMKDQQPEASPCFICRGMTRGRDLKRSTMRPSPSLPRTTRLLVVQIATASCTESYDVRLL